MIEFEELVKGEWVKRTAEYRRLPADGMIKVTAFEEEHKDENDGVEKLYTTKKLCNEFFRMMVECDKDVDFTQLDWGALRKIHANFILHFYGLPNKSQSTTESSESSSPTQ
jgi:hypothetical protein